MSLSQSEKRTSVTGINQALKVYRGASYVSPPKKVIYSDNYDRLSRDQSDQAVIALVHAANLSGGSVGDVDLYKLFRTYLQCGIARTEINAVVRRHGL